MTIDLSTTPRKPLTPRKRLKLYEEHQGLCALCGLKIAAGEPWRDEHMRALGLGGSNDWDNRAPVHIRCAEAKDPVDMAAINKAKDQKQAALGIKPASAGRLRGRGFQKFAKPSRGVDKSEMAPLAAKELFK